MSIVVATSSTTIFIDAQRIHINQGAAWAADSPVVKLHPDLFSTDPHRALGLDIEPPADKPKRTEKPVEQKTAAPGEKHDIKKPARGRGILGNLFE